MLKDSKLLLLSCFLVITITIQAQKPTQTIRGTVEDAKTHETLPGANIVLVDENQFLDFLSNSWCLFR